MNEKEKESIEEFRKQLRLAINIDDITTDIRNDNAQTILNLIEKLQKENEELKADNFELNNRITDLLENIPVQKIKDKIEELNNISNAEKLEDIMIGGNYTITELVQYVLQELIEGRSHE